MLAALDKDRSAAMGASQILALVVGSSSNGRPEVNPDTCTSLLQMGAVERLSQMFQSVPRTNQQAIKAVEMGTGDAEGDQPYAEHPGAIEGYGKICQSPSGRPCCVRDLVHSKADILHKQYCFPCVVKQGWTTTPLVCSCISTWSSSTPAWQLTVAA